LRRTEQRVEEIISIRLRWKSREGGQGTGGKGNGGKRTLHPILDPDPSRDDALDILVRVTVRPRHFAAARQGVLMWGFERGGYVDEEEVCLGDKIDGWLSILLRAPRGSPHNTETLYAAVI
jgi:hypothetical protein